jgi:hypothetical protein
LLSFGRISSEEASSVLSESNQQQKAASTEVAFRMLLNDRDRLVVRLAGLLRAGSTRMVQAVALAIAMEPSKTVMAATSAEIRCSTKAIAAPMATIAAKTTGGSGATVLIWSPFRFKALCESVIAVFFGCT